MNVPCAHSTTPSSRRGGIFIAWSRAGVMHGSGPHGALSWLPNIRLSLFEPPRPRSDGGAHDALEPFATFPATARGCRPQRRCDAASTRRRTPPRPFSLLARAGRRPVDPGGRRSLRSPTCSDGTSSRDRAEKDTDPFTRGNAPQDAWISTDIQGRLAPAAVPIELDTWRFDSGSRA